MIFRVALGEIMDEHLYDDLIAKRNVASGVKGIRGVLRNAMSESSRNAIGVDLHALVDEFLTVKEAS
ncbi:MAG: hypothetical protein U0T81_01840 [Saprospiraceae bacterium]